MKQNKMIVRKLHWVLFSIVLLGLTTGFQAIIFYGVQCVLVREDWGMIAVAGRLGEESVFISEDGGFSWDKSKTFSWPQAQYPGCNPKLDAYQEVRNLDNPDFVWRVTQNLQGIEESQDGGQTWQTIFIFPKGQEIKQRIYARKSSFFYIKGAGWPYNLIHDPVSKNLVLSMGFDGVLVITPEHEATWASVGGNKYKPLEQFSMSERTSFHEWSLAIFAGLLCITICAFPFYKKPRMKRTVVVFTGINILSWLFLSISNLDSNGQLSNFWLVPIFYHYPGYQSVIFLYASATLTMIFAIGTTMALSNLNFPHKSSNEIKIIQTIILNAAMVSGLLYMVPYFFYSYGVLISSYRVAIISSLVLATVPAILAHIWLRLKVDRTT